MDAPALCDSILQFVGSGLPAQGDTSNFPVTDTADEAAGERVSGGKTPGDAAEGDASRTGSTAAEQRLEQQGLMRALMGNKLGEYNMRGVEAGMGMVNVNNRKTGKLLNSGRRQRREEQSTPYGRGSSSRGNKNKSMATKIEHPQAGDAQSACPKAANTQTATAATARPTGSSVSGTLDRV